MWCKSIRLIPLALSILVMVISAKEYQSNNINPKPKEVYPFLPTTQQQPEHQQDYEVSPQPVVIIDEPNESILSPKMGTTMPGNMAYKTQVNGNQVMNPMTPVTTLDERTRNKLTRDTVMDVETRDGSSSPDDVANSGNDSTVGSCLDDVTDSSNLGLDNVTQTVKLNSKSVSGSTVHGVYDNGASTTSAPVVKMMTTDVTNTASKATKTATPDVQIPTNIAAATMEMSTNTTPLVSDITTPDMQMLTNAAESTGNMVPTILSDAENAAISGLKMENKTAGFAVAHKVANITSDVAYATTPDLGSGTNTTNMTGLDVVKTMPSAVVAQKSNTMLDTSDFTTSPTLSTNTTVTVLNTTTLATTATHTVAQNEDNTIDVTAPSTMPAKLVAPTSTNPATITTDQRSFQVEEEKTEPVIPSVNSLTAVQPSGSKNEVISGEKKPDPNQSISTSNTSISTNGSSNSDVPDSDVPEGDVPGSDIPTSDVPESDESEGDAPESDVPESNEAEGDEADSDVPESDVPEGDVPGSDVPESDVPEIDEPESDVPESDESESEESESEEAESDVPESDVPESDVPGSDEPKGDVPESDEFESDVPESDVPKSDEPVEADESESDDSSDSSSSVAHRKLPLPSANVAKERTQKSLPKTSPTMKSTSKSGNSPTVAPATSSAQSDRLQVTSRPSPSSTFISTPTKGSDLTNKATLRLKQMTSQHPQDLTQAVPPVQTSPAASSAPIKSKNDKNNMESVKARAKRAESISGNNGAGISTLFALAGGLGCMAIIAIVVYLKQPSQENEMVRTSTGEGIPMTTPMGSRLSEESIYNDPLGTRYSSIVMITPNGEGVCIL